MSPFTSTLHLKCKNVSNSERERGSKNEKLKIRRTEKTHGGEAVGTASGPRTAVHFLSCAEQKTKINHRPHRFQISLIINWMYSTLVLCLNKLYIGYSLELAIQ